MANEIDTDASADGAIDYEFYELTRVTVKKPKPGEFHIASAAVRSCGTCGRTISGMGGPGGLDICIPCGDVIMRGAARGCIKWEDDGV